MRTGPLSDGASNQAPGKGERPRICRSSSAAGRVHTREDMQNTGQTDIGQALRMLDPAVH